MLHEQRRTCTSCASVCDASERKTEQRAIAIALLQDKIVTAIVEIPAQANPAASVTALLKLSAKALWRPNSPGSTQLVRGAGTVRYSAVLYWRNDTVLLILYCTVRTPCDSIRTMLLM